MDLRVSWTRLEEVRTALILVCRSRAPLEVCDPLRTRAQIGGRRTTARRCCGLAPNGAYAGSGRALLARAVVEVFEESAHDLARCRDGNLAHELYGAWDLVSGKVFATVRDECLCRHGGRGFKHDIGLRQFTFDLVGNSGHCCQRDIGMHAQD